MTATPNQALERTAPRVTPAAPPPSPAQPSRRAGQSLSLRSFGKKIQSEPKLMKILKYIAPISAGTFLVGAAAVGSNIAEVDNEKDARAATPPECHLAFSPDLRVDSVFIYPTTIGIRPTAKLKVGTPAEFSFSNLHGEPAYERKLTATLMDGDPAFWIAFPKDVPARVAVKLTIQ